MNVVSPWAAAVNEIFNDQDLPSLYERASGAYKVNIHHINNALWITVTCPKGCRVVIRAAYAPTDHLKATRFDVNDGGATVKLKTSIGLYEVNLHFPEPDKPLIRYTTTLTPADPLVIPFWPRDMVITGKDGENGYTEGRVHITQEGTRTGLQFISLDKPKSGTLLYLQTLTALNDYCQATETSLSGVVGGQWPELGFALPPTKDKPLPAGKAFIIADAFLAFSSENIKDEMQSARLFMDMLASVYLHLPKPETQYHDWPQILDKGLNDLQTSHACWSHANGHDYLNAYVSDYATPPELMVQLAVLLPLQDYEYWSKKEMPAVKMIKDGIGAFYDEKLGTVVRWLPALADDLDGSEEQLKPNVMDSWYLNHPLLNLGRMALRGDKKSEKLFLSSLGFTIKVARHFKYNWPVFYNMETLEVVKAETAPGKGGEKDVAGLYAHVMLHAWELTKDDKYLSEAKKAAKTLQGKGFELFYQANNTAFSANAMLWLHKITNEPVYLNLSYLCLANVMRNFQLWECNYGYAQHFTTFFGIFPLNDAPYTAAYEEQEVFSAMHNYLIYAEGMDVLPSVSLLLAEFIRYIVQRAVYYYPPNLPKDVLSDEVKMGEVDPNLWIAIEDIHDGWEQSGTVGQEVYGAGVAFGIVPRHYRALPNESFMIYVDYPTSDFKYRKGSPLSFWVRGDEKLTCRMMLLSKDGKSLPKFKVVMQQKEHEEVIKGEQTKEGNLEYVVRGNCYVTIRCESK